MVKASIDKMTTNKKHLYKVGKIVDSIVTLCDTEEYRVQLPNGSPAILKKYLSGNEPLELKQNIRGMVINVDKTKDHIYLALIPELLNSDRPLLKDYSTSNEGNWFLGVVERCEKSYVVVKFLNNISGILHRSEMNITHLNVLESLFSPGDVILTRVLSIDRERRRITLSMKIPQDSANNSNTRISNNIHLPIIRVTHPKISDINTLSVVLEDQQKCLCESVVVPDFHLTDFIEHISIIKEVMLSENVILEAAFLGRNLDGHKANIASLKKSMIQSINSHSYPVSISDISIGMLLNGYVMKIQENGAQIIIGINLVGFLPKAFIDRTLQVGETLLVLVKEIDHQKARIILSFDYGNSEKLPQSNNFNLFGSFLLYLKELIFISRFKFKNSGFEVGKTIQLKVVEKGDEEDQYFARYNDISAILYDFKGNSLKNGDYVDAMIIYWDLEPLKIYAAISDYDKTANPSLKVKILHNFNRFSLGVTTNSQSRNIVFVYTYKNMFGELNDFELNSVVLCHAFSSFHKLPIVVPIDDKLATSKQLPLSCTITEIKCTYLKVRDQFKKHWSIHISEINNHNNEGDRPFERLKVGDHLDAYKLTSNTGKRNTFSSLCYRRMELSLNCIPRPVNKSPELTIGQPVTAFVSKVTKRWIILEVSAYIKGYMSIVDLKPLNEVIHDPLTKYIPGTCVKLSVIGYDMDKKIYQFSKHSDLKLVPGDAVFGRVYRCDPIHGICVDLPCFTRGRIHVCNISRTYTQDPFKDYPIFSYLQCRILEKRKSGTFSLSIKHLYDKEASDLKTVADLVPEQVYPSYFVKFIKNRLKCWLSDKIFCIIPVKNEPDLLEFKRSLKPLSVIDVKFQKAINHKSVLASLVQNEERAEIETKNPISDVSNCLKVGKGFDWKTGKFLGVDEVENKVTDHIKEKEELIPAEKIKKFTEREIRIIESKLASNTLQPSCPEDFDRLVARSPNSSIIWINYIAYYLQAFEIEKARKIAERALNQINYREDNEICNVYLCYINMEVLYGTPETHEEIYSRALNKCNKKKLIKHMIAMYQNLKQVDLAERECLILLKLYSTSKKSYCIYGQLLASNNRFLDAKNVLRKALQNLPEKKRISTIVHFALLEFRYGDVHRASTLIEKVLDNFPNRLDIWFVYIDQLIKACEISQARSCFEKITNLPVKKRKRMSIYKKYLSFEEKYGSPDNASSIKTIMTSMVDKQDAVSLDL